ncbi:autotransporter outer membrane beta-barrel domain-containing protein [Bartonella bacilliformis]|uniref:Outer membrane autotransporter n=1 Tax=Bartonella bacilliformis (strain ATCC 35685 / KC583 / Herrer 020/F12,63) TaxID=360095 RepID=A1UTU0_BARBK|nr:autotransporter outer membrane beta-barrel domain-containing protein [Bartonella bacilliformis]ABM44634.1 outer membrane autotransporter [Bartonella bacilliformis KC583]AMG86139.1 autotransporter outer membrane beta-barrel domain-containing protein [Bartonella bacilliformis]
MLKKNILLCTVAGTLLCSNFNVAFASVPVDEIKPNSWERIKTDVRVQGLYGADDPGRVDFLDDQANYGWGIAKKIEKLQRDVSAFSKQMLDFEHQVSDLAQGNEGKALLRQEQDSMKNTVQALQGRVEYLKTQLDSELQKQNGQKDQLEQNKVEVNNFLARVKDFQDQIKWFGDVLASYDSEAELAGNPVGDSSIVVSNVEYPGQIVTIKDTKIHGEFPMIVSEGGTIYGVNVNTSEEAMVALSNLGGRFELYNSDINVAWRESAGIVFASKDANDHVVKLVNTNIHVEDGVGIFGSTFGDVTGQISLENSKISADILVKKEDANQSPLHLTITADNSVLRGGIRTALEERASVRAVLGEREGVRDPQDTQTDQQRQDVLSLLLQRNRGQRVQLEAGALEVQNNQQVNGVQQVLGNPDINVQAQANQDSTQVSEASTVALAVSEISGEPTSQPRLTVWDAPQGVTVLGPRVELAPRQQQVDPSTQTGSTSLSTVNLDLRNNSKWYLTFSKHEMDDVSLESKDETRIENRKRRLSSDLSSLKVHDSSVIFVEPKSSNHYKTLYVGFDNPERNVYVAKGDARLLINAELDDSKKIGNLKSDQVIVSGNVIGNTTIHVQDMTNSELVKLPKITHRPSILAASEGIIPLNERGVSVVQVFGTAKEDSFKLSDPYITLGGSPYKYVLKAYGPGSQHGESREADVSAVYDLLTANSSESPAFWDYRLQNEYIDSDRYVSAIVPQAASYLVMSNAVFSSGLADVINHNTLITSMQKNPVEKKGEQFAISLSSYGNKLTLSSDRTPFDYGYHADVNYGALQAGLSLVEWDNKDSITHFGLLGNYGRLFFTPKDVPDSDESNLNKWSVAVYSSTQHYDGFYANALISYGMMKGTITNAVIGDTATIDDAKAWNISLALGKKIDTEVKGVRFEPEAQLVYQGLNFETISDIDKFDVDMDDPRQWLVRVGGRVSKIIPMNNIIPMGNKNDFVSLYTKLHLIKTFSDNSTITMGDQFHVDSVGSSLEGGLGFVSEFSNSLSLHSEISYRCALQRSGTSGTSFSGGIRYRF